MSEGGLTIIRVVDPIQDPRDDPDHVPTENERWYDAHVAPTLKSLGDECVARGMSLVAAVEIDRNTELIGTSRFLSAERGIRIKLVEWAALCRANVDSLIGAILRHARQRGEVHVSIYLSAIERALGR